MSSCALRELAITTFPAPFGVKLVFRTLSDIMGKDAIGRPLPLKKNLCGTGAHDNSCDDIANRRLLPLAVAFLSPPGFSRKISVSRLCSLSASIEAFASYRNPIACVNSPARGSKRSKLACRLSNQVASPFGPSGEFCAALNILPHM